MEEGTSTSTTTTSTTPAKKEICCNEVDDDGDGLENGADPDCQVDVELEAGKNSVCWATEVLDYSNNRDYYSGWFKCPEGYIVDYVMVSFLSNDQGETYLPLERGDCLISYNENNQVRRKVCGYEERQEGMNCSSGYIDYKTGKVSPVYICIEETGNPKTNKVRLEFISDSEKTATGVMVGEIYCARQEKKTSEIKFWIEVNETPIEESEITLTNGTEVVFRATLNIADQTIYLERDGEVIATSVGEMSLRQTLDVIGTFNFTAYWPGNETYDGDSKSIIIEVIPPEETKIQCKGKISLSFNGSEFLPESAIEATVGNLTNCDGFVAYIKEESCEGNEVCSCTISAGSCSCEFQAPQQSGSYTYFACIDMDGDEVIEEGEKNSGTIEVVSGEVKCNPNRTDESGVCRAICGASEECSGKEPGTKWCEDGKLSSCNLECEYEEVDCSPYVCDPATQECKVSCSSIDDCLKGFVCDLNEGKCVACSGGKEVGGDSPDNKCEEACGASGVCDELEPGATLGCSFGNPNRRDICNEICEVEEQTCDASCPDYTGSVECSGKLPGSNWCDGNVAKSCDENCVLKQVDCSADDLTCKNGKCVEESEPRGGGGGFKAPILLLDLLKILRDFFRSLIGNF